MAQFSHSGVGLRICISNKFSDDADAASVDNMLWESLLQGTFLALTTVNSKSMHILEFECDILVSFVNSFNDFPPLIYL